MKEVYGCVNVEHRQPEFLCDIVSVGGEVAAFQQDRTNLSSFCNEFFCGMEDILFHKPIFMMPGAFDHSLTEMRLILHPLYAEIL